MKKNIKKLTAIVALGILPLLQLNAQGVIQVGPGLFVPNYDSQTLVSKGCDPNNWNKLVRDYVEKRTIEKSIEKAQIDQIIKAAPTAGSSGGGAGGAGGGGLGACFQSAASSINGAISQANQVLSIFDGSFDFSALASNITNQLASAACKQIDYVVGQQVGAVTGQITTTLGGITGGVSGLGVNTPVGNVNVGNGIINSGANNASNPIPYVSTNGINNATIGIVSGAQAAQTQSTSFIERVNPFRRTDPQNVPDPLK